MSPGGRPAHVLRTEAPCGAPPSPTALPRRARLRALALANARAAAIASRAATASGRPHTCARADRPPTLPRSRSKSNNTQRPSSSHEAILPIPVFPSFPGFSRVQAFSLFRPAQRCSIKPAMLDQSSLRCGRWPPRCWGGSFDRQVCSRRRPHERLARILFLIVFFYFQELHIRTTRFFPHRWRVPATQKSSQVGIRFSSEAALVCHFGGRRAPPAGWRRAGRGWRARSLCVPRWRAHRRVPQAGVPAPAPPPPPPAGPGGHSLWCLLVRGRGSEVDEAPSLRHAAAARPSLRLSAGCGRLATAAGHGPAPHGGRRCVGRPTRLLWRLGSRPENNKNSSNSNNSQPVT